jgi:hypothetical protein
MGCGHPSLGTAQIAPAARIVIRNHKSAPVTVEANEPIGGTWRSIRSTREYMKTDAWAAQFNLAVPADGTTMLKYRVRVTY